MWGLLAGSAALLFARTRDPHSYGTLAAVAAYLTFSWLAAAVVLLRAPRPLRPPVAILLVMVAVVALSNIAEIARWFDWIEAGEPSVRRNQMVLLLLAIGAVLLDCHFTAIRTVERVDLELACRIAARTREIEASRNVTQDALRSEAIAAERRRIIADMHDGLGASLIGLLQQVQSGSADHERIERRVREALREMRIAIDALQPHGQDVATVLGSLRYRLLDMIDGTGTRLAWNVDGMPDPWPLDPVAVSCVQRIVVEAVANALKHSGARLLRLSVRAHGAAGVEISVEDDGRGFDPDQRTAGLGLGNMRVRARRMGAQLEIRSTPDRGTAVRLLATRPGGEQASADGTHRTRRASIRAGTCIPA